ncbi:MAG: hypothetical protein GX938_09655, partial [Spirochaetales bacterium]|nr:hypothetical protein [Spirochaetales bacterium]
GFYRPRKSFLAEMRPEDLLTAMVLVPEVVVFLLALSVVTEAVRAMGTPGTEAELKAQLQEIWANSNDQVNLAVAEVREGVVQNAGTTRITGSNQTDSHRTENDGRPATAENTGRGPNNAEVGSTPDPTASGTSGDDGDDGRDGEGLQVETENLNLDRPRGDADRYQSPDTQPQPAGGQQDNVQAASTLGAVAVHEWAALAADIEILSRSEEDMKEKSKSIIVKEQAWDRQAAALQAPLYRVTVRGRGQVGDKVINLCKPGKNLQEVLWDAERVREAIPSLEAWNARGYDIYLTPIDEEFHHILLDDLTAEGVKHVKSNFNPCLIQTSSDNNFQAVLRVPKAGTSPEEQSAGNELLQKLNRLPDGCGGDRAISAPRHPFRMTGFANKKSGRNNFYTRIELLQPGAVCEKASRALEEIRERREGERVAAEVERKKEAIRTVETREIARPEGETAVDKEFRRHWRRLAGLGEYGVQRGIWSQVDDSVVDYRTCQEMLRQGYGDAEIMDSLLHCSPELLTRHRNPEDYCQRTLGAAKMALEVMGGGAMKETKEKPVYDGR